ncbi:MAG: helix-turn-helix transcriptional regulator [Pseudomonadota bacterium]
MTSGIKIPRERRLRAWMIERDISYEALAKELGVTRQRTNYVLRCDTMPSELHKKCVALGIPLELLPDAVDWPRGRKPRVPLFPALMNEAEAQQV